MKTKTIIVTLMLLIAACYCFFYTACTNPSKKRRPISYIFLCDTIDKNMQKMFHGLLYDPWMEKGDAISVNPPDNYGDISLTAFDLSSGDDPRPVKAFFPQDNDDDKVRGPIADDFMTGIQPAKATQNRSKNLLHALSAMVGEINDPGTDYRVIICSKMIENSGGPILDPKANSNWKNGHFHFVNMDDNCITQEVNEAKAQVDSSRDWVYKNLIHVDDDNPDFHRCSVKATIYEMPADLVSTPEYPYGRNDISRFWTDLFDRMGLKIHFAGAQPSQRNVLTQ